MSCPAAVDITAPALKELVECVSGTGQRALPRVAFEAFLSPVLSGVLGKKGPATDHPPSWVSSNSGLEGGEFAKSDLATLLLVHRAGRGYDILTNSEFVLPPRTKLMEHSHVLNRRNRQPCKRQLHLHKIQPPDSLVNHCRQDKASA